MGAAMDFVDTDATVTLSLWQGAQLGLSIEVLDFSPPVRGPGRRPLPSDDTRLGSIEPRGPSSRAHRRIERLDARPQRTHKGGEAPPRLVPSFGDSGVFATSRLDVSEGGIKLRACLRPGFSGTGGGGTMAARVCRDDDDNYLDWLARQSDSSRAVTCRSVDIVRHAVKASGGLGETWCIDGDDAIRIGNLMLVIEMDDLGWIVTAYTIDGAEADLFAVVAAENGNPVRVVTDWLRAAAGTMSWKRVEPGVYSSGGYVVGRLDTGEWFAEGPGVDQCFDHKNDAQAACAAARSHGTPLPASTGRRRRGDGGFVSYPADAELVSY